MMKKKGVGFKAVSLNDSFEEEEDLEEASPFPPPPTNKSNDDDVNEKEEEEEFTTPMTTFKIKTLLGSDDATAANDDGASEEERGVSAKTNVASGGNGNGGFGSNDSSPTTLIANESRDTISELRNNNNNNININASSSSPTKNSTNFLYNNHQQQYNHHQNRNEKDNNESDVYHVHNRSISATSMDGLISRLDEESGNGGVGERTNARFNEFSDGGGRWRADGSNSSSNAIIRACSKALDIPWCFGESRKTRKNVVSISIVLLLILFAAIPLRHWQHMS
jgi:hypothetical protein